MPVFCWTGDNISPPYIKYFKENIFYIFNKRGDYILNRHEKYILKTT